MRPSLWAWPSGSRFRWSLKEMYSNGGPEALTEETPKPRRSAGVEGLRHSRRRRPDPVDLQDCGDFWVLQDQVPPLMVASFKLIIKARQTWWLRNPECPKFLRENLVPDPVKDSGSLPGLTLGFCSAPTVPVRNVAGVAGAPSQLPCLVSHPLQGDAPVLVLWYKDGARFPFYTRVVKLVVYSVSPDAPAEGILQYGTSTAHSLNNKSGQNDQGAHQWSVTLCKGSGNSIKIDNENYGSGTLGSGALGFVRQVRPGSGTLGFATPEPGPPGPVTPEPGTLGPVTPEPGRLGSVTPGYGALGYVTLGSATLQFVTKGSKTLRFWKTGVRVKPEETLEPLEASRKTCSVICEDNPNTEGSSMLSPHEDPSCPLSYPEDNTMTQEEFPLVPSRLVVLDQNQRAVPAGFLGPLTEGEALTLYCVATGGRPAPEVTWWRGSTLLANRSVILRHDDGARAPSSGVGVGVRQVRTELSIPALTRDYLHANLTCRASNNNITEPHSTTLALDVYLRPTSVRIRAPEASLVEGQQTRLECVAEGAYPAATLAWTKTTLHGVPSTLPSTSRHLGERTSSFVVVVPEMRRERERERGVYYTSAPLLLPGQDVLVTNQRKAGVLVSGRNLVLQMVRRSSAGNYTCSAANTLAAATSNVVHLDIRYLPVCVAGPQTVAVAEGESAHLSCRVDAQPEDDLSFTWVFNNTLDTIEVEQHRFTVLPGISTLDYTPRSPRDYGTLSCWATNAVGTQADPCRFTVVEAGPPERVDNCVLVNLTVESLEVGCSPGKDGGLPQRFVARVYAAPTHTLLATMEEDQAPRFHVGGLTPGQDYLITVTAVNAKGASQPQQIDAVRLKVAEKRMVDVTSPPVSPLVGVFLGLVGGFVLLLVVGVVLSRARSNRCRCWGHREGDSGVVTSGNSPPPTITPSSTHAHAHAGGLSLREDEGKEAPDVLRTINVTAELLETQICPEIIPARVPPPPYTRTQTATQTATTRESQELPTLAVAAAAASSSSSSTTTVGGGAGQALFRDTGSPLHLLHEESFV
ncbi:uncharacterized protein [Panulirus ornatus]|uniref:uncharacterized protein n=1 Tax=Panulirus ornatus TaxID=150431 RepID=UPI003A8362FF